jgi:hypothetical protein
VPDFESRLLEPITKVLGDATLQEFISRALVRRWQNIDQIGTLILIGTIVGSGVAGAGTVWLAKGWEWFWSGLTVVAIIFSIENLWLSTSEKVWKQREFYTGFVAIRGELDKLREDVKLGIPYELARSAYDDLYARLNKCAGDAASLNISIVYTNKLDCAVTQHWKVHMKKKYGYEVLEARSER